MLNNLLTDRKNLIKILDQIANTSDSILISLIGKSNIVDSVEKPPRPSDVILFELVNVNDIINYKVKLINSAWANILDALVSHICPCREISIPESKFLNVNYLIEILSVLSIKYDENDENLPDFSNVDNVDVNCVNDVMYITDYQIDSANKMLNFINKIYKNVIIENKDSDGGLVEPSSDIKEKLGDMLKKIEDEKNYPKTMPLPMLPLPYDRKNYPEITPNPIFPKITY